ncbi:MAG: transporter [Novosphingobium sp.]
MTACRHAGAGVITVAVLLSSTAAWAGPPFLTDDPEPTETGHWEIYAPLFEAEGRGIDFTGSLATEINYGAIKDVQLTVSLPVAYAHDQTGSHWGAGDFEVSVKYRFFHNEAAGIQIAVFPGVTLPTATNGMGAGHITALLPVWGQKDFGRWSVFGGGGYAINPGVGNCNYWTGGIALTRQFGDRLVVGVEGDRQGADVVDGRASTSLGIGAIYDLPGPLRLLASGGPTFGDGGTRGFHAFAAVGIDF